MKKIIFAFEKLHFIQKKGMSR